MTQSKFSKVYMKIAKSLFNQYEAEEPEYGWRPPICPNFSWCETGNNARKAFTTAFKPINKDTGDRWYDSHAVPVEYSDDRTAYHSKVRDHRVFSLLLMHEMAKDYERLLND